MNFIADVMLGSLAKRLRLLGFDVLYIPGCMDNDVLRLALEQGRTILTRDTGLASRPLARGTILIGSDHVEEQIRQVIALFPPPGHAALTRCSVCNTVLISVDRNAVRDRVPDHVLRTETCFLECSSCGRIYWKGSHVKNMARRGGRK